MKTPVDIRSVTTTLDRRLAAPMFGLTLLFMVFLAAVLYLQETEFWGRYRTWVLYGILAIYPIYPLEALLYLIKRNGHLRQHIFFCLLPVTRLGARDHITGRHVWLPIWSWQAAHRDLGLRLTKVFSVPMILIALLVLPVVLIELFYSEALERHPLFQLAVDTTSAFIWLAFVLEFVLVISVSRHRWRYCRQNWVDIAVIGLPLLDFLRIAQLGQILALKQLTRTARVYRLRGLVVRAWRALLTLEVIDKILRRDPEIRLEKCRLLLSEKHEEVEMLKNKIRRLEHLVAVHRQKREVAAHPDAKHREPVDAVASRN